MTKKKKSEPAKVEIMKPVQPKPEPKLNEKDREILKEMDRIIWNPGLLNKFKEDGQNDGHPMNRKGLKK